VVGGGGVTTVAVGCGAGCSWTSMQPVRVKKTSGSSQEIRIGRTLRLEKRDMLESALFRGRSVPLLWQVLGQTITTRWELLTAGH
jgi:hypothetical protein